MKAFLIPFLSITLLANCRKEISDLPPATQTGAGTFAAKVNGKPWAPHGFGIFPTNDILEGRMSGTELYIQARNFASSPTETEFELGVFNVTGPGTYMLNSDGKIYPEAFSSYGYYVKRFFTPKNEWKTSSKYTGQVIITKLDTVNRIVSGTFEFDAINLYNTPEPIKITEGRFDLKLK